MYFTFLEFFSVYNFVCHTSTSIDVVVEKTSEDRLQKTKCHLTIPNEAKQIFCIYKLINRVYFGKQSIYYPEVEIISKREKMT